MYKCTFFKIYELVPKDLYELHPEHKLWWLFDDRALITLDRLRNKYGKIVINNWFFGGEADERGIRPMTTATGASLSQHKFGRAFDLIFKDTPVGVVRQDCINKKYDCFDYITAIELGVSWFHFDTRNNTGELITFSKGV